MASSERRKHLSSSAVDVSTERWLISYADLATLLFAFFAVLFATSVQDAKKAKELEDSVKKFLARITVVAVPVGSSADTDDSVGGQPLPKTGAPIRNPIAEIPSANPNLSARQIEIEDAVVASLTESELKSVTDIYADVFGIKLVIKSQDLFANMSKKVKSSQLPLITKLARVLAEQNTPIIIESVTENFPASDSRWTARRLFDTERSVNIAGLLIRLGEIDPSQIQIVSRSSRTDSKSIGAAPPALRPAERIELTLITEELPF